MKIGIIGDGNVGSALQRGLSKAGHDARAVGNDPAQVKETARQAEVLIVAVPFAAIDAVARTVGGDVKGKVVIDVTNALNPDMTLAVGLTTSGAEELQKKLPGARVVKAFNTVYAQHMDSGKVKGEQLTVLAAGDDADAKKTVIELARGIGFDAVDAGPLQSARLLEPLALQNILLGYVLGMGTEIGFRLVH
ncbi:MAG TPA: NAD(P)-binding domain-containing protein [Solirubrobacteraceae bacterium]|nr:NAD(P)-binding domain-containing protein [Solirubrobacteraceae bacterium]